MKFVYIDQRGDGAAVLAAAYHAGLITAAPAVADIVQIPFFAVHGGAPGSLGRIAGMENGDEFYALSAGKQGRLVTVSAADFLKLLAAQETVKAVDVSDCNPAVVRLLLRIKKEAGPKKWAITVAAFVLKRQMPRIISKVDATKSIFRQNQG